LHLVVLYRMLGNGKKMGRINNNCIRYENALMDEWATKDDIIYYGYLKGTWG